MKIVQERAEDVALIRAITDAAFEDMPFSSQTESRIIDALRAAGALTLSLVAVEADEVVGHAAFSPVTINGKADNWYGLGPVSVRPDRQKSGIGKALILDGLDRLKSTQAKGCVVLGDPKCYSRFGFVSDAELRYGDIPPPYLQRLVLEGSEPKVNSSFIWVSM